MKIALAILILATGLGFGEAARADYQDGLKAAQSGDFATALQEWRPLAEQGNDGAQNMLGAMYASGEGVIQDDKKAVKWWRLAAEQEKASPSTASVWLTPGVMASSRIIKKR